MSEEVSFGEFWDGVAADDHLPPDMTYSPLTVAMARTAQAAALEDTVPPAGEAPASLPPTGRMPVGPGDLLGDLQLLEVLGEGGMGVVHLARQQSLDREVAVKTVRPEVARDEELVAALIQEASLTGGLEHPNVVPIHTLERDPARLPLLVMKRVEGHTWSDLLGDVEHPAWSAPGRWSPDPLVRNLEVLLQVCDAVEFSHSRGILHRDLKPENVMVGAFGEVYLMDWGLAVPAGAESYPPGGSPPYMAPEMLDGMATEATDVYLLGSILHEVLTGTRRHRGPSRFGVLLSVLRSEPVEYDPSVPDELAGVCNRATQVEPAARFPSVTAFRQAIVEFLRHRGSRQLAAAAAERLVELRRLLEGETPDGEGVARHFAECRFGFKHALREWSENQAARGGLRDALDAMIAWEVEQGAHKSARRLFEERVALDPEPREELAALRKRLDAELTETARLRKLASDLDASVSSQERVRFLMGVVLLALVVMATLYTLVRQELVTPNHVVLIALPVVGLTLLGSVMYLGRRTLLANVFNRRVMYLLVLLIAGILLHRVVCAKIGLRFEQILATDLVLVTVVAGAAGILLSPWMFLLGGITAAGSILAGFFPTQALPILLASMATTVSLGFILLRKLKAGMEPSR